MSLSRWSSISVLLSVILLAYSASAASAVLGFDLGTEYIKAALVKPGTPLDIVLTKDSRRKETSAVAFKPLDSSPKRGIFPERVYGGDAMALAPRFPAEVYPNLKTLLGLRVDDAVVREYAERHPALQLQPHTSRRTAMFKSGTMDLQEDAWMVEELLAMELQNVQKNAQAVVGDSTLVRSVVLTVPPFYTVEEKRAVQTAAELAGLKVLGLISDGLAVGLNYATSRQFPNINEGAKPLYHLVFDMGAGSASATLMRFQSRNMKDLGKFNKTVQEVQVVSAGWDRSLGGDSLNYLIMDHIISSFVESARAKATGVTAESVKSNGRAMAKIAKEAERIRHVLSANQDTYASFEGLYEDIDFKYKLSRTEFEDMAAAHIERVGKVINDAVGVSQLGLEELTSIILHGGATRTPFVQRAIEKAVGSSDKMRSNVNADEAAVFGAGFRAAELSPSFRVKEIRILESAMYQAGLKWTTSSGKQRRQRLWSAISAMGGPAKEMTLNEQNDLSISFYQQVGSEDREIKVMSTKNLTTSVKDIKEHYPSCVETDITFKIAVKLGPEDGEIQVVKAAVECEVEVAEKEGFVDGVKNLLGFGKRDQQPLSDVDENEKPKPSEGSQGSESTKETLKDNSTETTSTSSADAAGSSSPSEAVKKINEAIDTASGESKMETKKKQTVSIPVDFALENAGLPSLSKSQLAQAKDRLKSFVASDKARIQREEALNQLESYAYEVRSILEEEGFISRSTEQERTMLAEKASEISDWLYEGGAEATKEEIKGKLKLLQDLVAPIQNRLDESEKRPELVSQLKKSLNQTSYFISSLSKQLEEYENWQPSRSVSISPSVTSSTGSQSPSSNDFDGLEDEDTSSSAPDNKAEKEADGEARPGPPLYTQADLEEIKELYESTSKWLSELEVQQAALPLTADPILVKELKAKQQKVEKAGMDLALKSIRSFESGAKKAGKKAGNKKKSSKTKADDPLYTIKLGDGDEKLSAEELEQMMDRIKKTETDKGRSEGRGRDKTKGSTEEREKHDEL